jgi:hypothetical protein
MITSISASCDLAALLNDSTPLTAEDAAETPRDWLAGMWVNGDVYPLDEAATTDTRVVLADGTAAVEFSPKGAWCRGEHRTGVEYLAPHWCDADTDSWIEEDDARGVTRDWRAVHVWDANGYSDTQVYPTLDEARAAFDGEVAELQKISSDQD